MHRAFPKPVVYVSKCLGFDSCRFNGQILSDEFVDMLLEYARISIVCPEVEIGLGVPRNPIRLVKDEEKGLRLQQYETERDVTGEMHDYASNLITAIQEVDGFILKSRSPSCGFSDVKVYPSLGKVSPLGKAPGVFAGRIAEAFPLAACEDEGRLTNYRIREHFLTRIFASAHWRQVAESQKMSELVKFQANYKYLLLGYNEEAMRRLGKIVANHEKRPVSQVFQEYGREFLKSLSELPERGSMMNVLYHVYGHITEGLKDTEKQFIRNSMEMYREERVPLSVPLHLLYSHAIRKGDDYIADQILFQPYPMELVMISDSGKGRNL